jgi:zinc/manganese transport system permease protein
LVGVLALLLTGVIARPLVLSSLSIELARARGVRVALIGGAFLLTIAVAVGLSALTSGSLLSTALLIGPAAAAVRCPSRLSHALLLAVTFGIGCTWLGIVLSYDSYNWMPKNQSLPVSFFIVVAIVVVYGVCTVGSTRGRRV